MRQRALEDLSPEALAALADKLTVIERKFRDLSDMVADLLIQLEVATPPPEEADLPSLEAEIPSSEPGFAPVPQADLEVDSPQPTPPDETPPGLTELETTESTEKLSEKWRLRVRW